MHNNEGPHTEMRPKLKIFVHSLIGEIDILQNKETIFSQIMLNWQNIKSVKPDAELEKVQFIGRVYKY